MFNIGGWEMAILAIAGLMFFGPDKLPQIMRQAGKIYRQIQKASSEFQYSISRELEEDKYKTAHRREKKRKKKLAEAGLLDPNGKPPVSGSVPAAPPAAVPPPVSAADAAADAPAVPTAAPAPVENTILPPATDTAVAADTKKTA